MYEKSKLRTRNFRVTQLFALYTGIEKYRKTEENLPEKMTSTYLDGNYGYPLEGFMDKHEARKYICPMCRNVLKNPLQVHTDDPKLACNTCYKGNVR